MGTNISMGGNAEYLARLERIKAGGIGTNRTIFVGIEESFRQPEKVTAKRSKSKEVANNALSPLSILAAFVLGLIAVIFGRYARFQVLSGLELEGQADMIANMAMSFAVGFALTQLFRLTSKEHQAAQGIGVFAGVCTFHNLVDWMPELFSAAFSPEWVLAMLATTEPNSILFRGITFVLGA